MAVGSRSPAFGWYVPDAQELIAAEVTLRELSTADADGGTWSPEQVAAADKLAGLLLECGPWAEATAKDVAEHREWLEHVVDLPLLEPLAEMYANLYRYQLKRHEWDRRKDSPLSARIEVDAASRLTTTNRPRKTELVRTWKERERLLKASRGLGLAPGPQQLLEVLIDMADARGICWPSTEKLAVRLGRCTRSVGRWRHELEALGLVKVDNHKKPNGWQATSTYRLNLARLTGATADTPYVLIGVDTAAASAPTPESDLLPYVLIGVDTVSTHEPKSLMKEPVLLEEREALQASPSSFNQCDDRYATARDRATAAVYALIARREAEEAAAPQLQEIVHHTPRLVQALVTASSEAPGHSTSQLVEQLRGAGAILAAQALLENPAGVERCKLIAEKKSIQNPAGYLLAMLRNGDHRLTVEEQERSEWSAARPQRHLVAV